MRSAAALAQGASTSDSVKNPPSSSRCASAPVPEAGAPRAGRGGEPHLLLLGGFLALALVLAPWASAAALRIAME